jgi:peroxiredoxin
MKRRQWRWIGAWMAVLSLIGTGAPLRSGAAPSDPLATLVPLGQQAPDFALPDAAGGRVRLSERTGQRATVVVFWYGGSEFSRRELVQLSESYGELKRAGIDVVGVNPLDDLDRVRETQERLNIAFSLVKAPRPTLRKPPLPGDVAGEYGVRAYPTTFVLDSQRTVRARFAGFDEAKLKDALAQLQ